jgi:predicted nucleic acid-binding protein
VRTIIGLPDEQIRAIDAWRRTRGLKLPDAITYATARVHNRSFATRNTKDFREHEADVAIPYVF